MIVHSSSNSNNNRNNNIRKEGNKTVRLNYKLINKVINPKTIVHANSSPF